MPPPGVRNNGSACATERTDRQSARAPNGDSRHLRIASFAGRGTVGNRARESREASPSTTSTSSATLSPWRGRRPRIVTGRLRPERSSGRAADRRPRGRLRVRPAFFLASRKTDGYPEVGLDLTIGPDADPARLVQSFEIATRMHRPPGSVRAAGRALLSLREHTRPWPMWTVAWNGLDRTDDPWGDLLEGSGRRRQHEPPPST